MKDSTLKSYRLSNKKTSVICGILPLSYWLGVFWRSPKQYRLFSLLLVAHWNLVVRPSCWRHQLLLWSRDIEKLHGTNQGESSLLASFHGSRRSCVGYWGWEGCHHQSYLSVNPVTYNNDGLWQDKYDIGTDDMGVTNHILTGFDAYSTDEIFLVL